MKIQCIMVLKRALSFSNKICHPMPVRGEEEEGKSSPGASSTCVKISFVFGLGSCRAYILPRTYVTVDDSSFSFLFLSLCQRVLWQQSCFCSSCDKGWDLKTSRNILGNEIEFRTENLCFVAFHICLFCTPLSPSCDHLESDTNWFLCSMMKPWKVSPHINLIITISIVNSNEKIPQNEVIIKYSNRLCKE